MAYERATRRRCCLLDCDNAGGRCELPKETELAMTQKMPLTLAILLFAAPCVAQTPVALVEDVRGNAVGLEFMDYVAPGKVIRLRPSDMVVLSYLNSCWSERIVGGTITVGLEQSEVQGGKVTRTKVPCNAAQLDLNSKQSIQSAGTVFRGATGVPSLTLYGLSPVVEAAGGTALLIVRLDRANEYHVATLRKKKGSSRSVLDLATVNKVLTPGGTYRASIGLRQIEFKVSPEAKPGRAPVIGRLLRFSPAS